eukprot:Pompholyxophrys_sp_v1_NODE_383_length_633_cov_3.984429.p2 type:complete len:123 gc:universal NODE_383_length_633_cov_3.984429:416-48(-)
MRRFSVIRKIRKYFQREERLMQASMIAASVPLRMTGRIWRKSPPRTIILFPNGKFASSALMTLTTSRNILSTASRAFIFKRRQFAMTLILRVMANCLRLKINAPFLVASQLCHHLWSSRHRF